MELLDVARPGVVTGLAITQVGAGMAWGLANCYVTAEGTGGVSARCSKSANVLF